MGCSKSRKLIFMPKTFWRKADMIHNRLKLVIQAKWLNKRNESTMNQSFIHLRLHTEYSLKDGLITIPSLMQKAVAFNYPALGISDLSNLYAAVKFYQAAIEVGIKPIIGADLWVMNEENASHPFRLTLFCQNQRGYQNLLKLISLSHLEGQIHERP